MRGKINLFGIDALVNMAAAYWVDDRKAYPEVRFSALGMVAGRVHALVFAETANGIRVISFRKANKREVKRYEHATQP